MQEQATQELLGTEAVGASGPGLAGSRCVLGSL